MSIRFVLRCLPLFVGLSPCSVLAGEGPEAVNAATPEAATRAVERARTLLATARATRNDPEAVRAAHARAAATLDALAQAYKAEAGKLAPAFVAARIRYRVYKAANPLESWAMPLPREVTADLIAAFAPWLAADSHFMAAKVARIECLHACDPARKTAVEEVAALCKERAGDIAVAEQPCVAAWYRCLRGRAFAILDDEANAAEAWREALDPAFEELADAQKAALAGVKKLIVYDSATMKMRAGKYSDVKDVVLRAHCSPERRALFQEDQGKEVLCAYAKALTLPADAGRMEYERAVRELQGCIAREPPDSAWSCEFAITLAEILDEMRANKPSLKPQFAAAEWLAAAHGAVAQASCLHREYIVLDKEKSPDAPARFEDALARYQQAVEHYRRAIQEARKTKLDARVQIEPRAWYELGLCYLRMRSYYEAVLTWQAFRQRYAPDNRVQWFAGLDDPRTLRAPGVNALQEALVGLDRPDGGLLARAAQGQAIALDGNAALHGDPQDAWNAKLKKELVDAGFVPATTGAPPLDAPAVVQRIAAPLPPLTDINALCGLCVVGAWTGEPRLSELPGAYNRRTPRLRQLMTERHGGSAATEAAVDAALRWLAFHQNPDGHWDTQQYGAANKSDTACTSLALLAFLAAGHSEKDGEYRANVQRAVAWLKCKQDADGLIWDTTDDAAPHRARGYPGAMATQALAEAAAMARVPDTVAAAQRAVDYCTEKHQEGQGDERGGWRYVPKLAGDLSVTAWFMMALKSAHCAGLRVKPESFDGVIRFLDSVEKKNPDGKSSCYWYMPDAEHVHSAHRLTAIGNLARQFMGWHHGDLQASVEWFVEKGGVPSWGGNGEKVDLYYWYYGTLCLFQQGGDLWKKWNGALKEALVPNQCTQGDDAGSWNPVGDFSNEWGRVGQTALCCLCLEVYYRYPPWGY